MYAIDLSLFITIDLLSRITRVAINLICNKHIDITNLEYEWHYGSNIILLDNNNKSSDSKDRLVRRDCINTSVLRQHYYGCK